MKRHLHLCVCQHLALLSEHMTPHAFTSGPVSVRWPRVGWAGPTCRRQLQEFEAWRLGATALLLCEWEDAVVCMSGWTRWKVGLFDIGPFWYKKKLKTVLDSSGFRNIPFKYHLTSTRSRGSLGISALQVLEVYDSESLNYRKTFQSNQKALTHIHPSPIAFYQRVGHWTFKALHAEVTLLKSFHPNQ